MKKLAFSYFEYPNLILIAFLIFLTCFIGIVIWTYRKQGKSYYDEIAQMPLKDQKFNGGSCE